MFRRLFKIILFPDKRQRIDLLIDLQEKIQEDNGAGYQRWAKVFNLKQMAKVLLFLQENDIHDYEQLGLKKIPKVAELNEEFKRLAKKKNAEYARYRTTRERMRNLANVRRNAEMILQNDDFERTTKLISK